MNPFVIVKFIIRNLVTVHASLHVMRLLYIILLLVYSLHPTTTTYTTYLKLLVKILCERRVPFSSCASVERFLNARLIMLIQGVFTTTTTD